MTAAELDEIMETRWQGVVRHVMAENTDKWLKGFVLSIARHGKRPSWHPSAKQEALMRRLLVETAPDPDPGFDLIER